jgi:hypothetical protein
VSPAIVENVALARIEGCNAPDGVGDTAILQAAPSCAPGALRPCARCFRVGKQAIERSFMRSSSALRFRISTVRLPQIRKRTANRFDRDREIVSDIVTRDRQHDLPVHIGGAPVKRKQERTDFLESAGDDIVPVAYRWPAGPGLFGIS